MTEGESEKYSGWLWSTFGTALLPPALHLMVLAAPTPIAPVAPNPLEFLADVYIFCFVVASGTVYDETQRMRTHRQSSVRIGIFYLISVLCASQYAVIVNSLQQGAAQVSAIQISLIFVLTATTVLTAILNARSAPSRRMRKAKP